MDEFNDISDVIGKSVYEMETIQGHTDNEDCHGEEKPTAPNYRLNLQNLVRTCNRTVHALKTVKDMIPDPAQRDLAINILASQLDTLRKSLENSRPSIEDVALEYLLPRSDMKLEFGMHNKHHAYLNYNVPSCMKLDEKKYIDIEEVLRKTAEEIARDINEYEDRDDFDPQMWNVMDEPNFFDENNNEFEDYDLSQLNRLKTIQIVFMRTYP